MHWLYNTTQFPLHVSKLLHWWTPQLPLHLHVSIARNAFLSTDKNRSIKNLQFLCLHEHWQHISAAESQKMFVSYSFLHPSRKCESRCRSAILKSLIYKVCVNSKDLTFSAITTNEDYKNLGTRLRIYCSGNKQEFWQTWLKGLKKTVLLKRRLFRGHSKRQSNHSILNYEQIKFENHLFLSTLSL